MAAIAASYTVTPCSATTTVLYTAPTGYQRDLVLTNGGTAAVYVGSFTAVTSSQGLKIASGATVLLTGATENVWGVTSAGTATMYVGQGSVVSVI